MVESALRTRLLALFWPWAPPLGSLLASWDRKKFYLHSILPESGRIGLVVKLFWNPKRSLWSLPGAAELPPRPHIWAGNAA